MNDIVLIQQKIYEIRQQKVMLDRDLAALYGVETRVLNQAVQRNISRFPEDFMFQLSAKEFSRLKSQSATSSSADNQPDTILKSQIVISSWGGARKRLYQTSSPHWLQCRRRHRQVIFKVPIWHLEKPYALSVAQHILKLKRYKLSLMIRNLDNFYLMFKQSPLALMPIGVGFCVDFEHQR